jgi:hypothetical protein
MIRIYAAVIPAFVIEGLPVRDGSDKDFERHPVSKSGP